MNKILIIVGPTASGKSEIAVKLAKKFNGEIISCDSRQIYKGMDLGTGKVTGKWVVDKMRGRADNQQSKNFPVWEVLKCLVLDTGYFLRITITISEKNSGMDRKRFFAVGCTPAQNDAL